MKVTVTLKDILKASKAELDSIQMSSQTAFYLASNMRQINKHSEIYEQTYQKLVSRLSIPGANSGERIIPPEHTEEFAREMSDLLNTKVELSIMLISMENLPTNIEYGIIDKLYFMIKENNHDVSD